jgi:hypothetical protein
MSNLINDFKNIPKCGIIGFISSSSYYLFFSSTLPSLFCTHLLKLKEGIHDCKELQDAFNQDDLRCEVIKGYSKDPGSIELRSQYERIVHEYKYTEYKNMREGYKAIGYRLKKYVLNDFRREKGNFGPLVYVCGKSPSLGEIVLGIFDSIPEANDWCELTYGKNTSDLIPVFKVNELTQEYHDKHGFKICR